ncbi:MAG: response regulator [Cyanobacteriota bacterium]
MVPDIVQIEVSRNLIRELFEVAGIELPEQVDDEDIIKLIKAIKKVKDSDTLPPSTENLKDHQEKEYSSILVVDDLGLVVYQLSLLLTKSGYNVMLARSAPEAFSIFEERGPFDYVLMDLFMPNKEDGIDLLKKLKLSISGKETNTKVVVMSATKDLEAIEEVIGLGADSFLEKGQNWKSDLIETLQNI